MSFTLARPIPLLDICSTFGIELTSQPHDVVIQGISTIQNIKEGMLCCLHNKKYLNSFDASSKGVCITYKEWASYLPPGVIGLFVEKPYRMFAKILSTYCKKELPFPSISPLASVHESAILEKNVFIGPFSVIGKNVCIGEGTHIAPHVVIDDDVTIGKNCVIESHVSIARAQIGHHVWIKPGVRIGQSGFGFDMDAQGHFLLEQIGNVVIEDQVMIGANTVIDRGSLEDTVISKGCCIDSLVEIAHGVKLGQGCVVVAQTGIAGSTEFGKFVVAAGQSGFAGHLKIGDGAQIAAQSGVMRDITPQEKVGGMPAVPIMQWHRMSAYLRKVSTSKKADD